MKRLRILLLPLALVAAVWLFWPERYAFDLGMLRHVLLGGGRAALPAGEVAARLHAPPGLTVTRFASDLPNVRMLRVTSEGDVLASQPRAGRVVLLERDENGDGSSDGTRVLLGDLDRPHGIDARDGWLYVAEASAVRRVRFDAKARAVPGEVETIVRGLPEGGNHWTHTLGLGPDGGLYVSAGSSCNVCIEKDARRAAILRYALDGTGEERYATGLRNAVGFDWDPASGALYATDNGRDYLGDDFPPCELDRVVRGGFYGWPFANGDRRPDPDLGGAHEAEIAASIPPAHAFRAHNAPLGIAFRRTSTVPAGCRSAALVALHGSWNRRRKDGYKVVELCFKDDGTVTERDFLTGFLDGETTLGRPAGVAEGPDGAIYVSDDYGGAVYRIAAGDRAAPREVHRDVGTKPATPSTPADAAPGDAARGARLYAANRCASCHEVGAAAPGVVARPLVGLAQRYTPAALADYLRAPTPPMPTFPLSAEERADLATFLLKER